METLQRTANRGSISTGYDIDNSIKTEADNSEWMQRATGGGNDSNVKQHSISAWVKRTELGGTQMILSMANIGRVRFNSSNKIEYQFRSGRNFTTTRVFRDTSAWMHIFVVADTTLATASDRMKLYINGVRETVFDSYTAPDLNHNSPAWGVYNTYNLNFAGKSDDFYNGYIAETFFIGEQSLLPTDFGEFDDDSGIWKPKEYTGTFGSNDTYLDFKDSSNLGNNAAGGADLSLNNITSADQATDTPTNNFCTLNPLYNYAYGNTITEGATKIYGAPNNWGGGKATFGLTSGKWYWEIKQLANANTFMGLQTDGEDNISSGNAHSQNTTVCFYTDGTIQYSNGVETTTSAANSIAANSIVGFALDLDSATQTIKVYNNNSLITAFGSSGTVNLSTYNLADKTVFPFVALYDRTVNMNFGGYTVSSISSAASDENGYGTFEYAPPSGYYALCTKNLAEYG